MARMIGRAGGRRFTCGCCDWSKGKLGVKADEMRQVLKDVSAELEFTQDCPHGLSITDVLAKRNACYECWCLARGLNPWDGVDHSG
jgi:hypothetical protein